MQFQNFQIVLFNFIEGVTSSEQKLNDNKLEELGKLLAKIHESKKVIGPYPVRENFENPFKEKVLDLLKSLEKISPKNDYQKEAKDLYLKYREKFLNEIKTLDDLSNILKNQDINFVNCHGESSPDNIMIDSEGEIYLIDWDFPLFAPKEKDLVFFNDRFDQILKGYQENSDDIVINKDIEEFYKHLWNAQEIEAYGSELLINEINEEEYQANLKELKNFLNYSGLE